jgi:hypothetical protein
MTSEIMNKNNMSNNEKTVFRGFGPMNIVERIFNAKRQKPSKDNEDDRDFFLESDSNYYELGRDKRSHVISTETTHDSVTIKSETVTKVIAPKHKKYGYVDVNLIPRPTAVLKLRDNKAKKGKLRKFFNKFHFRKRKKLPQKTKRENREPRFSPMKKLKSIFKGKKKKEKAINYYEHDYEMMTSHIDTFKPVKYNKAPTIDEISKQIPNITTDVGATIEKPLLAKHKPLSQEPAWDIDTALFNLKSATKETTTTLAAIKG